MNLRNGWRRNKQGVKKRVRLKRKERMSAEEWLADWYSSLHAQGWTFRGDRIGPKRVRLTQAELAELEVLSLQKGSVALYLHRSVETIPPSGIIDELLDDRTVRVETKIRIVRGRRPDNRRGVARLPNGTATRILSGEAMPDQAPFLVEFDGALFEPRVNGDWGLVQDPFVQELYEQYQQASAHRKSFRPYARKEMAPPRFLLLCGSNAIGEKFIPLNVLK